MHAEGVVDPKRGRRTLVLVGLLFIAPMLLAWTLFQTQELWWSGKTGSYGELVTPARPVQLAGLEAVDHGAVDATRLRGRWTLVMLAGDQCSAVCRDNLYSTRQVHAALDKDRARVQRLFVPARRPEPAMREELERIDPALIIATAPAASLARIRQELALEANADPSGSIYLVDPLGNLMMRYPTGADGKRMLKDLRRLLKVSRIG